MDDGFSHRLGILDLIKLSTRIFRVKPLRTFLTIVGTAIGIGTVIFLISLGYGMQFIILGKLVTTQDSLITVEASYPSESEINLTVPEVAEIARLEEAGEVSPVAEFPGELNIGAGTGVVLVRVVQSSFARLSGLIPDVGTVLKEDELGMIITSQAAKLMGLGADAATLGKEGTVKVFYPASEGMVAKETPAVAPLPIRGIITDELEPPAAYLLSRSLVDPPVLFKGVYVKAKDIVLLETLRDKLTERGFLISSRLDLVNQSQKILNAITMVLGVFGVGALVVSAVGMFNTMIVSFLERIYEVGVMKSLGASDRDVRNLFLIESLLMGLAGGATGVLLGVGGGFSVNIILGIVVRRLGGEPFDLFITPLWFVFAVIISSGLVGLIAGFWPAHRARGLSPMEAFLRK